MKDLTARSAKLRLLSDLLQRHASRLLDDNGCIGRIEGADHVLLLQRLGRSQARLAECDALRRDLELGTDLFDLADFYRRHLDDFAHPDDLDGEGAPDGPDGEDAAG